MKILPFFIALVLSVFSAIAQDLLISKSGDTTKAIVLYIYYDNIQYRKFGEASGPVITVYKYDLSKAVYANGKVDDFTQWKKPASDTIAKEPLRHPIMPDQISNDHLNTWGIQ